MKAIVIGVFIWSSQLLGDDSHRVWEQAMAAADQAYRQGDYRQSLEALRSALPVGEPLPVDQPRLAATLVRLGSVYVSLGSLREAEQAYLKADAIWNRLAPQAPERSTTLLGLQTVYFLMGELKKSERYGRQCIAVQEAALGPEHLDLGKPMQSLAAMYQSERRYPEAEELYRRALRLLEKGDSSFDETIAMTRGNLASLLAETGRIEDAIAEGTRAVATMEAALGREHPRVAARLINLAALYCRAHRWAEAEEPARRAHDIVVKCLGPEHFWMASILETYADVLQHTGRKREARQAARRAQTIEAEFRHGNGLGHVAEMGRFQY